MGHTPENHQGFKRRSRKNNKPRGKVQFNTLHVGSHGRRMNPKAYACGLGTFAIEIKGRKEGDGGHIPDYGKRSTD